MKYQPGEHIKVEFKDERTGESEWMWVKVHRCDDQNRIVFGSLDNMPIAAFTESLKLGQEIAVSFDLIRDVWREPGSA